MNVLRRFYGPAAALFTTCALLLTVQIPQAVAESVGYEGTATVCFVSAIPPIIEEKRKKTLVEGAVSVYLIETDHPLVSGWEVIDVDWKITHKWTFLSGQGVLVPYDYEGTDAALVENIQIKTNDLSTISGTWEGTDDLLGTTVEYELIPQAEPVPACDYNNPPAVCDDIGGCIPALPPITDPIVYDISGWVTGDSLPLAGVTLEGSGVWPVVPSTAVVGPGVEFYLVDPAVSMEVFSIDFDENGLVTVTNVMGGTHVIYGDLPLTFAVIGGPAKSITGFELGTVSGATGITQTDLTFTENTVSMQLGIDTMWDSDGAFSAQMLFFPDN